MLDHFILDLSLRVTSDDEGLRAAAADRLKRFRATAPREPDMTLRIVRSAGASPPPTPLRLVWRGRTGTGLEGATHAGQGRRRFEVDGYGWIDLNGSQAELHASHPDRQLPWNAFLLPLICYCLGRRGWCTVHGASLAVSRRGRPHAVLIVAPSETGKSTAALALSRSDGWRLLGDDAAFVGRGPVGPLVWSYTRDCHVRDASHAFLPWLRDLPLRPTREPGMSCLPLEELHPGPPLAAMPAALVVCLRRPNAAGHRLERIDAATALAHVAHEAVQALEGPADSEALRDFAVLAELVRRTPPCALSVGPRLDGLDRLLLDFLAGERHEPTDDRSLAACLV